MKEVKESIWEMVGRYKLPMPMGGGDFGIIRGAMV